VDRLSVCVAKTDEAKAREKVAPSEQMTMRQQYIASRATDASTAQS
jgi:hypothetical protein